MARLTNGDCLAAYCLRLMTESNRAACFSFSGMTACK